MWIWVGREGESCGGGCLDTQFQYQKSETCVPSLFWMIVRADTQLHYHTGQEWRGKSGEGIEG